MEELKFTDQDILSLIEAGDKGEVLKIFNDLKAADISEMIEDLRAKDIMYILRLLDKETSYLVFEDLDHLKQADLVEEMNEEEFDYVMGELYFDDKIDLLAVLPPEATKRVKDALPYAERKLVDRFLNYPIDSAGSIMTIEFIVISENMDVRGALDQIKRVGMTKGTIYTLYVVDDKKSLVGVLSLRDLVTSGINDKIKDIMNKDPICVNINDDREEVAEVFIDYGFLSVPVINRARQMQGIITVDDIMEVMEEETTEDLHRMAAITPHEEAYLDIRPLDLAKNRIVWLLLFMITSTFTGAIISSFESMLAKVTVLSVYMPMLMSTGGNAGNQASATIIREIATIEIKSSDIIKVVLKESSVAIICAGLMAVINFFKLIIFDRVGIAIGLTVSLTLVFIVIIAKVIGGILPMVAEKLGLDPAIMAGPLIGTLTDAGALILYFQFGKLIVGL